MLKHQPMQCCSAVWSSCWSAFGWSDVSSQHFLSQNRTYCQGLLLSFSLSLTLSLSHSHSLSLYLGLTQTLCPSFSLSFTHSLNLTHFILPSVSSQPYPCFGFLLMCVTRLTCWSMFDIQTKIQPFQPDNQINPTQDRGLSVAWSPPPQSL